MIALMLLALILTSVTALADLADIPEEAPDESGQQLESGEEKPLAPVNNSTPTAAFIVGASALVVIAAALWFIAKSKKRSVPVGTTGGDEK